MAVVNIALLTVAFVCALLSLERGKDFVPTTLEAWFLGFGLVLAFASSALTAYTNTDTQELAELKAEEDRAERRAREEQGAQLQARSGRERRARPRIVKSVGVGGGRASRRR